MNTFTRLRSFFNTIIYSAGSIAAISKSGKPVYTNPILKKYRDLFEQEFNKDERIFDIEGTGLPLGVKTLSIKEAVDLLKGDKELISQRRGGAKDAEKNNNDSSPCSPCLRVNKSQIIEFLNKEIKLLTELKNILTGEIAADGQRLMILIDECDYLWAHFPDCTGGQKPDINDVSFLKRVRVEIDPMLKIFENLNEEMVID